MKKTLLFIWLISHCHFVNAQIVLPNIFSDNMVIQQKSSVKIWGWGHPSENVIVSGSWDDMPYQTTVNNNGKWEISFKTPMYGGPYNLKIKGNSNEIVFKNILLGEVWLVSGQSNMAWSADAGIDDAAAEISKANYPEIRFYNVTLATADYPQQNCVGFWTECSSETMRKFSAIGYFFAQHLHENLKIPVGIINSSWGGTPAEAWTPTAKIFADKTLAKDAESLKEVVWGPVKTSVIFNAMVAPLAPYKLKGALWYQGESNVVHAQNYDKLLHALIGGWRETWKEELPFYYVQIAPYNYEEKNSGVLLRNAQRLVENLPNTGMVVISDIGNPNDIHPRNKKDVGKRLGNLAMKNQYFGSEVPVSGPRLIGFESRRNQLVLYFDTEDLKCNAACKEQFEIANSNGEFSKANVNIRSNSIILQSNKVNYPIFGRFAWGNTQAGELKNSYGLPASSFVTDNWLQFMGY